MPRKKIHRFLTDSPIPDTDTFEVVDERLVHQIGRVLKMHEGEEVSLFSNGSDDTIAEIKEISKTSIVFAKTGTSEAIVSTRRIIAAIAIPKGDTFELIVQKLTELGVDTIVPLITDRTIKQSVRLDRLQTIRDEALEQSGGNRRVTITESMNLKECLTQFPFASIACEPGAASNIQLTDNTAVLYIGPEGGWSEGDIELLNIHNVTWHGLGDRILRTETAAIVGAFTLLNL